MRNRRYYQIGCCFLLIFLFLGASVLFNPHLLTHFDQAITELIRSPYPLLNQFFIFYTKLANPMTIGIVAVAVAGILFWKKYYAESLWLLFNTAIVAGLFNHLVKQLVMRPRPTLEHLVSEHSYSFPSGHSTGSVMLYGTIILLLPLFIKRAAILLSLQLLIGFGIVLIGISRVYLGVHFPSDILGGFSFGLFWLLVTYPTYLKKRLNWQGKKLGSD